MHKKLIIITIIIALFIIGCSQELTEEQLEEELEKLSDQELNLLLQETNTSDENTIVGEAQKFFFQKYKAKPEIILRTAKKILLRRAQRDVISIKFLDGRHLQIKDKDIKLGNSLPNCEDVFIAKSFVGRQDFYKLLTYLGYTGFTEEEIIDTENRLIIFYKDGNEINNLVNIRNGFSATRCQEINYFGFQLYCFNEINISGMQKDNNLDQVITYLTFLLYTSNEDHNNGLIEEQTSPYRFVLSNNIKYYDASFPQAYGETLISAKCRDYEGPANYQNRESNSFVFICPTFFNDDQDRISKKVGNAAILYHEANHKYQEGHQYSHKEDHDFNSFEELAETVIRTSCSFPTPYEPGVNRRDYDFKSVYGTHINYLFSVSQNEVVPCEYQQYAFDLAEREMKTKLCQYPNQPHHNYERPVCS